MARTRRSWGAMRKLPSGKYQASYQGPDMRRHVAPITFQDKDAATVWLSRARKSIEDGTWGTDTDRDAGRLKRTVMDASESYLTRNRARPLRARTVEHYRTLIDRFILPAFGDVAIGSLTVEQVEAWYFGLDPLKATTRAHAYGLLTSILKYALPKGMENPCQVEGAGQVRSSREIKPATLQELAVMEGTMPPRLAAMIPLTAWCALRFGEVAELRRKDIDLAAGVVRIERGVTRVKGRKVVGTPKAESIRVVSLPPHIIPTLEEHLRTHVDRAESALLFPATGGGNLAPSTLYRHFYKARDAAGRPDMNFHALRHTGATMAARAGATLTEQMARLGHKTPQMAIRYQHAAADRDREIAASLSRMAGGQP